MDTIVERIKKIIAETLGVDETSLNNNTNFTADLQTDSLDLVEVMVAIEKEFRICIPDEEVERIRTVDQVIQYVNKTDGIVPA